MWKLNSITDNLFTFILDLNFNFWLKNKYYSIQEAGNDFGKSHQRWDIFRKTQRLRKHRGKRERQTSRRENSYYCPRRTFQCHSHKVLTQSSWGGLRTCFNSPSVRNSNDCADHQAMKFLSEQSVPLPFSTVTGTW